MDHRRKTISLESMEVRGMSWKKKFEAVIGNEYKICTVDGELNVPGIKRRGLRHIFSPPLLKMLPLSGKLCITHYGEEGEKLYQKLRESFGDVITDEW